MAPRDYQQLHHFVCGSCWTPAPLETALAHEAGRLVGGPDAVLIADDTTLLRQGRHSVGVARQYSGAAGKLTNCQVLVSLTLARGEVPVSVALRRFLPAAWTADAARGRAAGVPEDHLTYRSKGELALAELDRVCAAGVPRESCSAVSWPTPRVGRALRSATRAVRAGSRGPWASRARSGSTRRAWSSA